MHSSPASAALKYALREFSAVPFHLSLGQIILLILNGFMMSSIPEPSMTAQYHQIRIGMAEGIDDLPNIIILPSTLSQRHKQAQKPNGNKGRVLKLHVFQCTLLTML
jgi:hypothetical protein